MLAKKVIKKFGLLFSLTLAFLMLSGVAEAGVYEKTFTITAYYSPIPCQDRYVTGSLFGDKVLNGNGTNGADGTPVYTGMVAAPSSYAFGTKMFIPGVGTVAVHDRGGAIVTSNEDGSYDRLDIWMGYGDPGLTRALNWGRRTLTVTVYGLDDSIAEQINLMGYTPDEAIPADCGMDDVSVDYNTLQPIGGTVSNSAPEPEPVYVPEPEPVVEEASISNEGLLDGNLSKGDSGVEVESLQLELLALNYYKGEIHGVYDDVTEHAVFKFQQSQYLVGDSSSIGAGVFGNKTRNQLNDIIASKNYNTFLIAQANPSISPIVSDIVLASISPEPKTILLTTEMDFGIASVEVEELQQFLKNQGHFSGVLITDFYGPVTRDAVIEFQLENGLISDIEDFGAGRVGPKTLSLINQMS